MDKLKQNWWKVPKPVRQSIVLVVGFVVILAGVAMLVLPGPGLLVIFVGFAILAAEFERADKVKQLIMKHFKNATAKAKQAGNKRKS